MEGDRPCGPWNAATRNRWREPARIERSFSLATDELAASVSACVGNGRVSVCERERETRPGSRSPLEPERERERGSVRVSLATVSHSRAGACPRRECVSSASLLSQPSRRRAGLGGGGVGRGLCRAASWFLAGVPPPCLVIPVCTGRTCHLRAVQYPIPAQASLMFFFFKLKWRATPCGWRHVVDREANLRTISVPDRTICRTQNDPVEECSQKVTRPRDLSLAWMPHSLGPRPLPEPKCFPVRVVLLIVALRPAVTLP